MSASGGRGERADLRDLLPVLRRVNELRRRARWPEESGTPDPTALAVAEAALEERYRPSEAPATDSISARVSATHRSSPGAGS